MDRSDSGDSPHCAPLAAMPLTNANGYRMGFLLFLVANSIFTLEEFVITISFLRLGWNQTGWSGAEVAVAWAATLLGTEDITIVLTE